MNAAQQESGAPAPVTTPTVLVVEDEVLVRMAIATYLRDCGFRVIEAGSADEAIIVLRAEPAVDIVFSDVQMQGAMDGFGLAQWVRRERPGVRTILTSGIARSTELAGDLCEEGPLLAKPYSPQEVERRIRWLLAHR